MKIGPFDLDRKVMIVAEIGNNHEGNYALAEELIGKAADAGADAVKFQTFRTEHYASYRVPERFARLKRFQLGYNAFERLAVHARKAGIIFFSTPFDLESVGIVARLAPVIKIASGDNTFYPLMQAAALSGRPIMLSTGIAGPADLRKSISVIQDVWHEQKTDPGLALLHCVAAYPVPMDQANLGAIRSLSRDFGLTVGYSDHTMGIDAAVLAVAAGARIIEKHFTIANDYSAFRDHQLSANPATMKQLVQRIREVETALGSGLIDPQPAELNEAVANRRSIAAADDLPAGTLLALQHITWVRPGDGLPPGDEARVIGRKLGRALRQGEPILMQDLA
jgi:N,N'-diacetyllegionaminate synthase